jgi:tRNA(His) 5'-end guanylyltransferase
VKPDDFDARMRRYEAAHDLSALSGVFLVARLDGRGFTRLTKELYDFEAPFDLRFCEYMVSALKHLMTAGFRIVYGHTQSDEISLLFDRDDDPFDRKLRKLHSILAGEASASFSLALGGVASFDCRISQLPAEELVVDYFRWRQEDATRNALNAHCYWLLRKQGKSAREASAFLSGQSTSRKNELLFVNGTNFARLPKWQKRGVGVYRESVEKVGVNPKTGAATKTTRRQIRAEYELPKKDAYSDFVRARLAEAGGT